MREADWLIDVGPGADVFGELIVAAGTPAQVTETKSITGNTCQVSARSQPLERRVTMDAFIEVTGAQENNLRNITARFPLGKFIAVTGVSGSGGQRWPTLSLKSHCPKKPAATLPNQK